MYDEDNVDLEEQLYLQEVQEELDAEEAALEELEENEEYDPTDYTLTKSFLREQLKKKESERINIKVVHKKTGKIFVPVSGVRYSSKFLKKNEFEDIENYLWLFTKDWPLIYEVYEIYPNPSRFLNYYIYAYQYVYLKAQTIRL